jgi:hypothetical protein
LITIFTSAFNTQQRHTIQHTFLIFMNLFLMYLLSGTFQVPTG